MKLCKYSRQSCTRLRYRDYDYCFQHILEDKSAPFIPCQYISKITHRRCHNPAPKTSHSSFASLALCDLHQQIKTRSPYNVKGLKTISKYEDSSDGDKARKSDTERSKRHPGVNNRGRKVDTSAIDSYDFDAKSNKNWCVRDSMRWKYGEADVDADSSDDGETGDDLLKTAGTYTLEEVTTQSNNCLLKLQSLYLKQFGQLQRKLQIKRRHYLLNRTPQELSHSLGSASRKRASAIENERLQELQALIDYRRHKGENLLLQKKAKRRRIEASSGSSSLPGEVTPTKSRCGHSRCKNTCLPYTKYCFTHILEDPLQVLYKKCAAKGCSAPICLLHYSAKRKIDEDVKEQRCFCILHEPLRPVNSALLANISEIKSFPHEPIVDDVQLSMDTSSATISSNIPATIPSHPCNFTEPSSPAGDAATSDTRMTPPTQSTKNQAEAETASNHTTVSTERDEKMEQLNSAEARSMLAEGEAATKGDDLFEQSNVTTASEKDSSDAKVREPKDVSKSDSLELTTLDLEQISTGQCYVMSRVSLCDSELSLVTPAIHLEPLEPNDLKAQSLLVPRTTSSKQNIAQSPGFVKSAPPVLEGDSCAGESGVTGRAQLHHTTGVFSVSRNNDTSEFQRPTDDGGQKITSTATLIPPVLQPDDIVEDATKPDSPSNPSNINKSDECCDEEGLLSLMPPLAPLSATVALKPEEKCSSQVNGSPLSTVEEVAKTLVSKVQEPVTLETDSPTTSNTDVQSAAVISPPYTEKSNGTSAKEENKNKSEMMNEAATIDDAVMRRVATTEHSDTIKWSPQSPDASDEAVELSEGDSPRSDRKPSSADEETAVASLLSLSSGTVQKEG